MGNSHSKFKPEEDSKQDSCHHLTESQTYKGKMRELSINEDDIVKKLRWLEEDHYELGKFYMEFGSKHPNSPVTALANDLNDEQWSEHNDLETQLYEIHSDLEKCRCQLNLIKENAKKNNCQCMKPNE